MKFINAFLALMTNNQPAPQGAIEDLPMLKNLLKATVSVAVAPIALVADTLMLPADAEKLGKPAYSRTAALLRNAGKCVREAVKPSEEG